MVKLFKRAWQLQVDDILIDGSDPENKDTLDITFNITKTKRREPNKAAIDVYNLNPSHREQLQEQDRTSVILKAGYVEDLTTIFNGDVRDIESKPVGPDVITQIEGEDGGTAYRNPHMSRSFPPDTSVLVVLKAAVNEMGIGIGNLRTITSLNIEDMGTSYPEGTMLAGAPRDIVDRLVRSVRDTDSARTRYSWSIQNGNFMLRRGRRPIQDQAINLNPDTGLIESPARNKRQRGKPRLTIAKALLIPGVYPGRVIVLDSKEISGNFAVYSVSYKGSTFSNEWFCEMQLEAY